VRSGSFGARDSSLAVGTPRAFPYRDKIRAAKNYVRRRGALNAGRPSSGCSLGTMQF